MKIRRQFMEVILTALLLLCFGTLTGAQELSQQELSTLSPSLHAALYPEVMCGLYRADLGPPLSSTCRDRQRPCGRNDVRQEWEESD